MFKKKRTVAAIMSGFSTMIAELRSLEEACRSEAETLNGKITELAEARYAAIDEATKAANAADKIEALTN